MNPPTDSQLNLIQILEEMSERLGQPVRFDGSTKQDAWYWINEYKPMIENLENERKSTNYPTKKQLELIKNLEEVSEYLGRPFKFHGTTKQDAWLWTKEHKPIVDEMVREAIAQKVAQVSNARAARFSGMYTPNIDALNRIAEDEEKIPTMSELNRQMGYLHTML